MEQVRQGLDDEDTSLFLNACATANPPQPAELPCLGRAWMAQGRKRLDDEDKVLFCKCGLFSRLRGFGIGMKWDLRDIDGATHFQGIAMKF